MTRPSPLLRLTALASFVACSSSTDVDTAAAATDDAAAALARHSISIGRLDQLYTSEVRDDFGGSEELWAINTVWQWKKILQYSSGISFSEYHSYLGCYNDTSASSGYQKRLALEALFAPYKDDIYVSDGTVINTDERACYLMSAKLGVFWDVLEKEPENVTKHLELQPAGPSMKMLRGFYDAIERRLMGEDVDVATTTGENITITQDEEMVIDLTICPVIKYLLADPTRPDVTFPVLAKEVTDFMVQDSGKHVKNRDFFYQAYNNSLTNIKPERMKIWHDTVVNVTSRTDDKGYNQCLNRTIQEDMHVYPTESGGAYVTFPRKREIGREDEECIFYLVRAASNHPYICQMELRGKVTTFDDDGTKRDSGAPFSTGASGASIFASVAAGLTLNVLL